MIIRSLNFSFWFFLALTQQKMATWGHTGADSEDSNSVPRLADLAPLFSIDVPKTKCSYPLPTALDKVQQDLFESLGVPIAVSVVCFAFFLLKDFARSC